MKEIEKRTNLLVWQRIVINYRVKFLSMAITFEAFDLRIQPMDYDLTMEKYSFQARIQDAKDHHINSFLIKSTSILNESAIAL